ncbi:MAG: pseudaminic acid cytidylyltransferase [Campylobacterales bacterium]|nr:pseudaminic acid cytidylyltransferase [Campylobacterales bacterium]
MNVAIIPARGGSKRIPRKNIKDFCGKPMIAYSIEAALESELFGRVIVSTDDEEIASVAKKYGAEVPFMRPKELSDDFTPTIPVIAHALEQLLREAPVNIACCIYATAPFIQSRFLKEAYAALIQSGSAYSFSAASFAFPIQRAIKLDAHRHVEMFYPEHFNTRSQDLEEAYHDAGQFYFGAAQAWMEGKPIFTKESTAIILPRYRVQDIDTPEDFKLAELMYGAIKEQEKSNVQHSL